MTTSVQKHYCGLELGLGLRLELKLGLAEIRFDQMCFRASVL